MSDPEMCLTTFCYLLISICLATLSFKKKKLFLTIPMLLFRGAVPAAVIAPHG